MTWLLQPLKSRCGSPVNRQSPVGSSHGAMGQRRVTVMAVGVDLHDLRLVFQVDEQACRRARRLRIRACPPGRCRCR